MPLRREGNERLQLHRMASSRASSIHMLASSAVMRCSSTLFKAARGPWSTEASFLDLSTTRSTTAGSRDLDLDFCLGALHTSPWTNSTSSIERSLALLQSPGGSARRNARSDRNLHTLQKGVPHRTYQPHAHKRATRCQSKTWQQLPLSPKIRRARGHAAGRTNKTKQTRP